MSVRCLVTINGRFLVADSNNKTNNAKLTELINRYPSEFKFHMYRNFSFGAGGMQLLILMLLAQIGSESKALTICLYSSVLGMPMWVALGWVFEYYILVGKKSYPHYKSTSGQAIFGIAYLIAGLSMLVSICSIMYQLDSTALWLFGVGVFVALTISINFHKSLANALFDKE